MESTKAEFIFDVRFFSTYFYLFWINPSIFASTLVFKIWAEVMARMLVYYFQVVNIDIKCFIFYLN